MQFFKGDEKEQKLVQALSPIFSSIRNSRNTFYNMAYTAFQLGEVIWDTGSSPIVGRVPRNVFREAFPEIFNAFQEGGSLESYLTVFRKVFGDEVDIEFVVPEPGHLQINISSDSLSVANFIGYDVVDNQFEYFEVIDHEGDNIVFQSIPGLTSQYEVELFLVEMIAGGVFVEVTLSLGGGE